MTRNPYLALEKALGYRFKKKHHLEMALTHRSFRFENPETAFDNQRLEFLGDAALGLVSAASLYLAHPEAEEGELTRLRSRLTNSRILAAVAAVIGLGDFLRLGRGELQTGGKDRTSTLCDALEAVLGGAYLDGGLKAVQKIFDQLIQPEMDRFMREVGHDNPKGALQEYAQQQLKLSPRYVLVHEEGPAHERRFTVEVLVNERRLGIGHGPSKREAEFQAAEAALKEIRERPPSPDAP